MGGASGANPQARAKALCGCKPSPAKPYGRGFPKLHVQSTGLQQQASAAGRGIDGSVSPPLSQAANASGGMSQSKAQRGWQVGTPCTCSACPLPAKPLAPKLTGPVQCSQLCKGPRGARVETHQDCAPVQTVPHMHLAACRTSSSRRTYLCHLHSESLCLERSLASRRSNSRLCHL